MLDYILAFHLDIFRLQYFDKCYFAFVSSGKEVTILFLENTLIFGRKLGNLRANGSEDFFF